MSKVELHYYLENNFHSMDAFVKNKAEAEILKILREVSSILDLELDFEIEALESGGIREFFKILKKKKNQKVVIPILTFFGGIISAIIVNVVSEKINQDSEYEQLKKDELKLRIEILKNELNTQKTSTNLIDNSKIENLILAISNTDKIKLYKSNFYSSLLREDKVERISTQELDENNNPTSQEKFIDRSEFQKFIIEKIEIEPEERHDVNIEIVSPVLKNGKIKWKGIYDSQSISFNLLDSEFKQSVLNREISFANGTSIRCDIELEREMDEDGDVKVVNVNVYNITKVFQGELTIEIKGKKRRKSNSSQMTLFGGQSVE